jgi:hypothetical protein
VPRVGSSRWFPGEFLKRWVWPVAKTTVTSPEEREMQVRILPRNYARVAKLAKRLVFRGRRFPGQRNLAQAAVQQITPASRRLEK